MKRFLISLMAGISLLAPGWALNTGDAAPPLDLPRLAGASPSVGSTTVVVWLPCGNADDLKHAPALAQLCSEAGAQLVIIPVTGADGSRAQALVASAPGATVLSDPDGRVILSYSGEFIPGVCPNPNLFIVGPGGAVSAVRQYPGVAPSTLASLLSKVR